MYFSSVLVYLNPTDFVVVLVLARSKDCSAQLSPTLFKVITAAYLVNNQSVHASLSSLFLFLLFNQSQCLRVFFHELLRFFLSLRELVLCVPLIDVSCG